MAEDKKSGRQTKSPLSGEGRWRGVGASPLDLLEKMKKGEWTSIHYPNPGRDSYRVDTGDGRYFAKYYRPVSLWGWFSDFVWDRKPRKAFSLGHRFLEKGLSTPRPLGLFFRGEGFSTEALLVTEWLEDAVSWKVYLTEKVPKKSRPPEFQKALRDIGELVGKIHRMGLYHGAFQGNLFFAASPAGCRLWVIDLEQFRRPLTGARRVKNLEKLIWVLPDLEAVSLRDRWVFLRAYAEAAGFDIARARKLWRQSRKARFRRLKKIELASGNEKSSKIPFILITAGVAAWVPYGILKYLLGRHVPLLPFLVVHLCGVLPGGYLKLRRRLEKRRNPSP